MSTTKQRIHAHRTHMQIKSKDQRRNFRYDREKKNDR